MQHVVKTAFCVGLMFVAWLLPVISIAWPLALASLALQLRTLWSLRREQQTATGRRGLVFAGLVFAATVVFCSLPIWGRHGSGPPIPGVPASYEIHAHPIWELGHVH
ncbi:MAG TPA: hypothetical protein VHP33_38490 [Polyangiaceae bacterium]|nr:hypothetical protein [Polyangiaceae bacterium]